MSNRRLLLVEDDRLIAATMSAELEIAGYEVTRAENVRAARKILDSTPAPFALAILDIHLPDGSGLDIARDLYDKGETGFLMLTAYTDESLVQEATALGALGYLVKPVEPSQLPPSIEAALTQFSHIRSLRDNESRMVQALAEGRETGMAVGVLMERLKLNRRDAFEHLRGMARHQRQRINDLAIEILNKAEQQSLRH